MQITFNISIHFKNLQKGPILTLFIVNNISYYTVKNSLQLLLHKIGTNGSQFGLFKLGSDI